MDELTYIVIWHAPVTPHCQGFISEAECVAFLNTENLIDPLVVSIAFDGTASIEEADEFLEAAK